MYIFYDLERVSTIRNPLYTKHVIQLLIKKPTTAPLQNERNTMNSRLMFISLYGYIFCNTIFWVEVKK